MRKHRGRTLTVEVEAEFDTNDLETDELIDLLEDRKLNEDQIKKLLDGRGSRADTVELHSVEVSISARGFVTGSEKSKLDALMLFVKRNFESPDFEKLLLA